MKLFQNTLWLYLRADFLQGSGEDVVAQWRALRASIIVLSILAVTACSTTPPPPPVEQPSENIVLIETIEEYGLEADESNRGVLIYLPKLSFSFNSAVLSNEAQSKLGYIARLCNSKVAENRYVVVIGHADSIGDEEYNIQLSRKRAEGVAADLGNLGVDTGRITTEWYGENKPIIPNSFSDGKDNPEGRAANRRVEIVILNP